MSYRPIGWDETYETYREKYDHVARSINLVYEAGADAMLTSLLNSGIIKVEDLEVYHFERRCYE